MSKSIREFFEEIKASETLQNELKTLLEQKDKDALIKWTEDNGCETTAEEAKEFFEELQTSLSEDGELSPDELEQASGGTATTVLVPITMAAAASVPFFMLCDKMSSSSSC